jgi:hypothetical protein
MKWDFLKWMSAPKLISVGPGAGQSELFAENGDDQDSGHDDPGLCFHGVGTGSVVVLAAQMAFDPAEEQLDSPAQTVAFSAPAPWQPGSSTSCISSTASANGLSLPMSIEIAMSPGDLA